MYYMFSIAFSILIYNFRLSTTRGTTSTCSWHRLWHFHSYHQNTWRTPFSSWTNKHQTP